MYTIPKALHTSETLLSKLQADSTGATARALFDQLDELQRSITQSQTKADSKGGGNTMALNSVFEGAHAVLRLCTPHRP